MKIKFSAPCLMLGLALAGGAGHSTVVWAQGASTPISAVQGPGDASPLVGQTVSVEGVVTADLQAKDQFSGFFLQDPQGDGDAATSEGIFVYVNERSAAYGTDVKVGDRVRVAGRVEEFREQTQIGRTSRVEILGQVAPLAPVSVELPLPAPASFERFEGMLVTFPGKLVVTAQNELQRFGALMLAAENRLYVPTNQKPLAQVAPDFAADEARRTLVLDDSSGAQSPKPVPYLDENGTRRTGSTVAGLTGILTFDYGKYRLQPTLAPVFENANPRPLAPPDVKGTLRIAAANVHNYWTTLANAANPDARGAKTAGAFERQSAKVVAELKGLDADVVGLMELENNGEKSIDDLVGKLNAAYGTAVYAKIADDPQAISPGPIKVGIIYKSAKVTPRGAPISAKDPIFDRYPLAQTFVSKNGGVFTFVVNHFKSKGSGPETGDVDKGEGAWNEKRVQQSAKLMEFIKKLQISSGDPDVLTVGDYNAYTEEAPILALRKGGLTHLNLLLPPEERYSFGYDGRFGSLDHALASPQLAAQVSGVGEWHINSDEPYFLDYPYVRVADFVADPFRASDHDPLLIGLNLVPSRVAKPVVKAAVKAAVKPKPKAKAVVKPKAKPVKKPIRKRR
ncbi:MAG TPA: ExeM/NucH family extracellular endonuclease [Abditibacterium sp.]|jgi:hypothetical protein